ncbi:anaerobic sulfatase maturase [Desulfosporosinus sp. SB140]|uniref:anaerobic sulfatase maturase n=1 Tax=Desulfosporosinus paludis TaxID=3115649 RepID=UPI003890DD4E
MPPLNILIKPMSSNCNLRCKYCFYHSIAENRETYSYGLMDSETLEILVEKALAYADQYCTFAFQGGEPTLTGLKFFEKLIELQKEYNVKNLKINNVLQTNGMIIDTAWARFLAEHNFLVGISLDGPKDIHDYYRIGINCKGSFSKVMKAIQLFNKHSVEYNILCVVTANVARHISKIYNFYKKHDFHYLQFIPCLDPQGELRGRYNYSLTPERYAYFLKRIFDEWYADVLQGYPINIRYFDNLVGLAMGLPPESCGLSGTCSFQFVVEADGGVYPCDFYVFDRWYIGNVRNLLFEEIEKSDIVKEFIEGSKYTDPTCKQCRWGNFCRGGCRRDREPFMENLPTLNYYCAAYKEFFEYASPRIYELARRFSVG